MGIISRFKKKNPASHKEKEILATPTAPAGAAVRTGSSVVIVKPYLSEKSLQAESKGVYTFVVSSKATKHAVISSVEMLYGVRPAAVRIINVEGRQVRFGRSMGRRIDFKKAIVTLPKGKAISIHEGV